MFINVVNLSGMDRELSLCGGTYITNDNALHVPKKWSGHASETIVWNCFVLLLIFDCDASQHSPKFFTNPCKAAFSPNFFTAKVFTIQ